MTNLDAVDNVTALVNRTTAIIDLLNDPLQDIDAKIPYSADTLHAAFWQVRLNLQEIDGTVKQISHSRKESESNA